MTTKTDTEQERADFEALEKTRFGYGKDTLVRYPTDEDEYYMPLTQARWEGYQAGRAALQSQDRKDAIAELLEATDDLIETQARETWTSKYKFSLTERMNASTRYQKARSAIDHACRVEGEGK